MTWQPIETAPRDGTWVLLYCPDAFCETHSYIVGSWGTEYMDGEPNMMLGFMWLYEFNRQGGSLRFIEPTHWMPLPEPPEAKR